MPELELETVFEAGSPVISPDLTSDQAHSGSENLKKSKQKTCEIKSVKIFFREICIFGRFPSSKIDFWPFLKLQKMEFG